MATRERLTRAEQQKRNRQLVLDAAREVFAEQGYAGATLEAIAERAGFSRGVMYSQFSDKADVFLAVLEQRRDQRARANRSVARRLDGRTSWRSFVRSLVDMSESEPEWNLLNVEFRAAVARDERLRARYAEVHSVTLAEMAAALGTVYERANVIPPAPLDAMASATLGLNYGMVLEELSRSAPVSSAQKTRILAAMLGFGARS